MLTEKATERKLQPQMKNKGTALLAGFFPLNVHVKKFNVIEDLQNRVKTTFLQSSWIKSGFRGWIPPTIILLFSLSTRAIFLIMAARSNLIFQIVFESVFFRDNAKQHNTYYRKPKGGFDGKPKSKNMGLYRLSAIRKYAAAFSGLYKPYIYC